VGPAAAGDSGARGALDAPGARGGHARVRSSHVPPSPCAGGLIVRPRF